MVSRAHTRRLAASRSHCQTRNRNGRADKQSAAIHGDRAAGASDREGIAVDAFKYLPELVKFGWIPFSYSWRTSLCFGLLREDVSRGATSTLMATAHFVLFTPFSVAWTKLAIRGRQAVAKHPAVLLLENSMAVSAGERGDERRCCCSSASPYVVVRYGQRNFDNQIALLGAAAMMLGLGVYVIGYVRLAFVFPAIAIGRYAGISAAWKQTAGNIERLAAILVLAYLPYWIIRQAFEWYMGYHPPGVIDAFRGCIDMLLMALATTALAGPALAYKAIVLDEPQDEVAAQSGRRLR